MLPTDLLPKAQQIIDRLAAINYENPKICEQRIREAFSRHLIALNLRDRPVEIYRSFDAAFDAAWKADRNRKVPWKAELPAKLKAKKMRGGILFCRLSLWLGLQSLRLGGLGGGGCGLCGMVRGRLKRMLHGVMPCTL